MLLDHAARDGLEGFITITGGKLMTYRLMAEWATDKVCEKLGVNSPCTTAQDALPGSRQSAEETVRSVVSLPASIRGSAISSARRSRQPGAGGRSARHQPGVRMRGGDRRGSALCGQLADRQ
ncbi:hypothetical protein IC615_05490 [Serratia ureilytica]